MMNTNVLEKGELRDEELEFVAGGNKWLIAAAIFTLASKIADWIIDN